MTFPQKLLIALAISVALITMWFTKPFTLSTFEFTGEYLFILGFFAVLSYGGGLFLTVPLYIVTRHIMRLPFQYRHITISASIAICGVFTIMFYQTIEAQSNQQPTKLSAATKYLEVLYKVDWQMQTLARQYKQTAYKERYQGQQTGKQGYGAYAHFMYTTYYKLTENQKVLSEASTDLLDIAITANELMGKVRKFKEDGAYTAFYNSQAEVESLLTSIQEKMNAVPTAFTSLNVNMKPEMYSSNALIAEHQALLIETEQNLISQMEVDIYNQLKDVPELKMDIDYIHLLNWVHFLFIGIIFILSLLLFYWHIKIEEDDFYWHIKHIKIEEDDG